MGCSRPGYFRTGPPMSILIPIDLPSAQSNALDPQNEGYMGYHFGHLGGLRVACYPSSPRPAAFEPAAAAGLPPDKRQSEPWSKLLVRGLHASHMGSALKCYQAFFSAITHVPILWFRLRMGRFKICHHFGESDLGKLPGSLFVGIKALILGILGVQEVGLFQVEGALWSLRASDSAHSAIPVGHGLDVCVAFAEGQGIRHGHGNASARKNCTWGWFALRLASTEMT